MCWIRRGMEITVHLTLCLIYFEFGLYCTIVSPIPPRFFQILYIDIDDICNKLETLAFTSLRIKRNLYCNCLKGDTPT